MLSYSPRRFEYIYQFQIDMAIRNQPYFDRINFQVHSSAVRVTVEEAGGGTGFGSRLFGNTINDPTYDHKYQEFKKNYNRTSYPTTNSQNKKKEDDKKNKHPL